MSKVKDLTGKVFGRLTVVSSQGSKNSKRIWLVKCVCGVHRTVSSSALTTGNSTSCGCLRHERINQQVKEKVLTRNSKGDKLCTQCDAWKPESQFHTLRKRTDGLASICKLCRAANAKVERLKKHGLSEEEINTLGNDCEGCGKHVSGQQRCIDHDHRCCPGEFSCGKCIRHILCTACNLVIGNAKDCPDLLRKLANMLDKWNEGNPQLFSEERYAAA
jgi:hypothetical protein